MKFSINKDHFSNGLQLVMNVVSTRATMPILANVLIEAEGEHVSLTTTNLDMGIRCQIKADVGEAGGLTLPVRKLATIVRELPSLDVRLESSGSDQVRIESGRAQFRIMGIDRSEFPPLPEFADEHSFVLEQSELARMLRSVSYAQSTDETRYIMNGVFFNFDEEKLILAATDGRRLAVMSREMEVTEDNAGKLILPAKTVAEVERLLGEEDTVRIAFNDRQVAFEFNTGEETDSSGVVGTIYLVSKVVEGNYPNYRQVIPQKTDQHLKINRESLLGCVRRIAHAASEKNNSVVFHVSPNQLEIAASSPEFGEGREEMAVEYDGPEVKVAFNPSYLMDPLRALSRDEVIFEFKDELSPGVFRTPDSFLCVIMPLRLN